MRTKKKLVNGEVIFICEGSFEIFINGSGSYIYVHGMQYNEEDYINIWTNDKFLGPIQTENEFRNSIQKWKEEEQKKQEKGQQKELRRLYEKEEQKKQEKKLRSLYEKKEQKKQEKKLRGLNEKKEQDKNFSMLKYKKKHR